MRYFCLEQTPTGSSTARTCENLAAARAQMSESIKEFINGDYYAKVKSITFIIGCKNPDNPVTGFDLVERVRITKDRSFE